MPIPRAVGRLNRVGLNRVSTPVATRLPGFGVVVHTGRKSGREYRTPVNVFEHGSTVRIALTYGTETDWVRNVRAADGCSLITRGRTLALTDPRLVHDERRQGIRVLERHVLRLLDVADFLELTVT